MGLLEEARMARLEAAFDRAAIPATQQPNYLISNQPNPFSGTTIVNCNIPATAHTAELKVTDLAGREISRQMLADRGQISTEVNLKTAPSGQYICSLTVDGQSVGTLKLVVNN